MLRNKRTIIILLILVAVCLTALVYVYYVPEEPFSKEQWVRHAGDDQVLPPAHRLNMLKDLTTHYKLTGIRCAALRTLLGPPDYMDSTTLTYEVTIHYNTIDPSNGKSIAFIYNTDSTITSYKIHDWRR